MSNLLLTVLFFFCGCIVLAVTLIAAYKTISSRIKRFFGSLFGTENIIEGIKNSELTEETKPKSLSGCDSLLIPEILKDFPDFNIELAKTYAKDAIKKYLGNPEGFKVHNVVISKYNDYNNEKLIVMQAAVEVTEDGRKKQKRYSLNYTYMLMGEGTCDGASCPNCGAPSPINGNQVCAYCGSRIADVLANTWSFTEITEK